jgi:hypothetical protein
VLLSHEVQQVNAVAANSELESREERQERGVADRETKARERGVVLFGLSNWDYHSP